MAVLLPNIIQQFRDGNGLPLAGGKLYTYAAGTTTPLATYTDASAGTPNANPVILDASGMAAIWIGSSSYKFVLKNSSDVVQWTVDNVVWIGTGYITSAMIASGAVGTNQIALLSITAGLMADNSVPTRAIQDGAVTPPKIPDGSITLPKLDPTVFSLANFPNTVEMVFSNRGDFSPPRGIYGVPQYPWSAPTKLTDPSTLPAGVFSNCAAWSPCGENLAIGTVTSPRINIYQKVGSTLVKLADPAILPTGSATGVAWSPDGRFLAVSHATTPFVTIYLRQGNTFKKLNNPTTLPTGQGNAVSWSPNSQFLTVAHATSPFVSIYQLSIGILGGSLTGSITGTMADVSNITTVGNTYTDAAVNAKIAEINVQHKELQAGVNESTLLVFTKLADPANLPAGTGNGCAWSSSGGFMTVAHNTTPFVTIYQRADTTFTKLGDPATLPPAAGNSVSWSNSEEFMAVSNGTTPFITIYQRSVTTFTKLTDPATLPAGTSSGLAFSPNGMLLAIGHVTTPFITIYSRSGTTFTKLTNPVTLPSDIGSGVSWTPNGQLLALANNGVPNLTVYQTASAMPTNAILWVREIENV